MRGNIKECGIKLRVKEIPQKFPAQQKIYSVLFSYAFLFLNRFLCCENPMNGYNIGIGYDKDYCSFHISLSKAFW